VIPPFLGIVVILTPFALCACHLVVRPVSFLPRRAPRVEARSMVREWVGVRVRPGVSAKICVGSRGGCRVLMVGASALAVL
jgi:hypothetical protein